MDTCEEARVLLAAQLRAVAVFSVFMPHGSSVLFIYSCSTPLFWYWIKNTIRMAPLNLCFYFVSVTSYKDKVRTQISVLGRLRQSVAASPQTCSRRPATLRRNPSSRWIKAWPSLRSIYVENQPVFFCLFSAYDCGTLSPQCPMWHLDAEWSRSFAETLFDGSDYLK